MTNIKSGGGNLIINRTIACSKTTREGRSRADTSDYLCKEMEDNTNIDGKDLSDLTIRKLTERECWRLMGFSTIENGKFNDEPFDKASKEVSGSQLYKQAGNSIVVNVLEGIFRNLI